MRAFFRRLGHVLSAPFRLIGRLFRPVRSFLNQDSEDAPATESLARALEHPASLIEHLDALRKHLLRSLVALIITTALSFTFAERLLDFLAQPIGGIGALQAIEVTESIGAYMRVSLLGGFVLAFPYIFFEFFLFANPGLKRRERAMILTILPFATLLFLGGMAFAYFVMLPVALPFLLQFMGIRTVPRPSNYIRFVSGVMFWLGMSFQFPLVMYALAGIGLVKARSLLQGWRLAIVGIAILAAAVTPTVDPVNMGLVMAPMIVLYFLSIGLAAIAQRGRKRSMERESA